MSSGGELNQLLMPVKLGALPCTAANCNDAASPLVAGPTPPNTHSAAISEADVANDRIVMAISVGSRGESKAELAAGIEACQPGHDQCVVLKVGGDRETDDHNAERLLQPWRDPRQAADTGRYGLSAIGDDGHRDRRADRVGDQLQAR